MDPEVRMDMVIEVLPEEETSFARFPSSWLLRYLASVVPLLEYVCWSLYLVGCLGSWEGG